MTDDKPTRRELLRPLHLLAIALACGVFAAGVTFVTTGAFTARVNEAISRGTYEGLTPVALGLVVGGGAFIATLLVLSMLILAVDPAQYEEEVLHRPVLFDEDADAAADAEGAAAEGSEAEGSATSDDQAPGTAS